MNSEEEKEEILVPSREYFAMKKQLNKIQVKLDAALDDARELIKNVEVLQKDATHTEK